MRLSCDMGADYPTGIGRSIDARGAYLVIVVIRFFDYRVAALVLPLRKPTTSEAGGNLFEKSIIWIIHKCVHSGGVVDVDLVTVTMTDTTFGSVGKAFSATRNQHLILARTTTRRRNPARRRSGVGAHALERRTPICLATGVHTTRATCRGDGVATRFQLRKRIVVTQALARYGLLIWIGLCRTLRIVVGGEGKATIHLRNGHALNVGKQIKRLTVEGSDYEIHYEPRRDDEDEPNERVPKNLFGFIEVVLVCRRGNVQYARVGKHEHGRHPAHVHKKYENVMHQRHEVTRLARRAWGVRARRD